MPGPGDYHVNRPVRVAGGKFNVSDPKRFIDQIQAAGPSQLSACGCVCVCGML